MSHEEVPTLEVDCAVGHDPSTFGYPACCVEAFEVYTERFQDGEVEQRPTIHCYAPCDACLARAPMEVLWREIVERRGFGCVNALDHLITHVEEDGEWTAFCPECAPEMDVAA